MKVLFNAPKDIQRLNNKLALNKENYSWSKLLVLAFLAGSFIAFGGMLSLMIGGGMPELTEDNPGLKKLLFGASFPLGLILVVITGTELFTGNNTYFAGNIFDKRQTLKTMFRNWFWVYLGNFIGSLFVVYFLAHLTMLFVGESWQDTLFGVVQSKTKASFLVVFLKGVGANWLVCLAIWLGLSAKDISGKILGLWWPVMAFVTLGFEHSIANMFFIPLGILEGYDLTWTAFVTKNLIPATLGNIVGGFFFVGTLFWFTHRTK